MDNYEMMKKPLLVKILGAVAALIGLLGIGANLYIIFSPEWIAVWQTYYAIAVNIVYVITGIGLILLPTRDLTVLAFGIYCAVTGLTFILNYVFKPGVMNILLPILVIVLFAVIKPVRIYLKSKEELEKENAKEEAKKNA